MSNSSLAIAGGAPAVDVDRHRVWPELLEDDRRAVMQVLDRGVIWGPMSPEITQLEQEWADYVGVSRCIAVNSGTAALHCCAAAVGLQPGDEVIVPAFSFSASAMGVIHQGAVPVFCDIDPRSYNIAPENVHDLVTDSTRAIMVVHIHGLPADMDELTEVAERHGLAIIEDAAQAHGATYRGQRVGSLGDCAAFSLNATKNLCGGEGGLFVTDDDELYQIARRLTIFGEDTQTYGSRDPRLYRAHGIGWNYRFQELSAALTRTQLRRLDEYIARAQANAQVLTQGLADIEGVIAPEVPDDRTSVFHKYRIRLDLGVLDIAAPAPSIRDAVVGALQAEGVEAVLWQPVPLPAQPAFRRRLEPWHPRLELEELKEWKPERFPEATRLLEESFIVGSESKPLLVQPPELMHQYVEAIGKVVSRAGSLVGETAAQPQLTQKP